ncbi:unnamed protein product, partial [Rotaria sp. Silwood1]
MQENLGLTSLLCKMADSQKFKAQLNALRCLGKLMTGEEIQKMSSRGEVAKFYVKFLSEVINKPTIKWGFDDALESLN